jgi:hypothetical protein
MSFCDCNCIVSYSFSYKEIIHTCLECESIGGTLGNVNHNVNCKYINCKHCQNYNIENDYDFFQDYNKDEINKFKKNLNQHIKNGNKIIHINQLKRVYTLIEEKTGRTIFHF